MANQPTEETAQIIQALEETQPEPRIKFCPEDLDPSQWELQFLESDCGTACTPNGCTGHWTGIPEVLVIAGVELKFNPDDYDTRADFNALRAVGEALNELIQAAKKDKNNATRILNLRTETKLGS